VGFFNSLCDIVTGDTEFAPQSLIFYANLELLFVHLAFVALVWFRCKTQPKQEGASLYVSR